MPKPRPLRCRRVPYTERLPRRAGAIPRERVFFGEESPATWGVAGLFFRLGFALGRRADSVQGSGVLYGGEVSRVAALGEGLDAAPEQLARAGLG